MSAQEFLFLTINIAPAPFSDGTGSPPVQMPGGPMQAWADVPLALAWRERARQLLGDMALRGSLYGAYDPNDRGAQAKLQLAYVADVAECFANYYNALNLPWDSDPRARVVYRRWIAGDPQGDTSIQRLDALYDSGTSYSSHWYQYDSAWARSTFFNTPRAGDVSGLLPNRARTLFLQYFQPNAEAVRHPTEFVVSTGLYTDADDSTNLLPDDITLAGELGKLRNRAFTAMGPRLKLSGGSNKYDYNVGDEQATVRRERQPYKRFVDDAIMFSGVGFHGLPAPPNGAWVMTTDGARPPHATDSWLGGWLAFVSEASLAAFRARDAVDSPEQQAIFVRREFDTYTGVNFDDWRMFWWDFPSALAINAGSIPLKAVAPLVEYLPMYEQWLSEITSRTPLEVIVQARAFATYSNGVMIQKSNGASSFINHVASADSNVVTELNTPDPTINAVSTGIGAFGAAVSVIGPVGAAIGLVAGAAAVAIRVFNAAAGQLGWRNPSSSNHRDDTGRWKPRIQPGWLNGSPVTGDANAPTLSVEAPPGWVRPATIGISLGGVGATPADARAAASRILLKRTGVSPLAWYAMSDSDRTKTLLDHGVAQADVPATIADINALVGTPSPSSVFHQTAASGSTTTVVAAAVGIAALIIWLSRGKK